MRVANFVLVATFITGQIGLPVGVPKPVVNNISVAPLAAFPVVASTSLPGVQTRFSPDLVAGSVESKTSTPGAVPPFLQAPALLIASVIRPSLILPGEGFMWKPDPTA